MEYKLMTETMRRKIDEVMQACFDANAIADNVVYETENKWTLNNASTIIHHNYAHLFPVWADKFQTILLIRGFKASRIGIKDHVESYETMIKAFEALVGACVNIEAKIEEALDVAEDEGNTFVKISLEDIYKQFGGMTKQALVWYEKSKQAGDDYIKFDKDFNKMMVIDEHGIFIE